MCSGKLTGSMTTSEIVRKRWPLGFPNQREFFLSFSDQLILIDFDLWRVLFSHDNPCFKLASINGSKAPSRTACVLDDSTPVLKSLIRLESRTYDRICLPHPISAFES